MDDQVARSSFFIVGFWQACYAYAVRGTMIMCSINKVDQAEGRSVRHRFSCPGCSTRITMSRRITSLGRKIKTLCTCCMTIHRVWVPPFISPTVPKASIEAPCPVPEAAA